MHALVPSTVLFCASLAAQSGDNSEGPFMALAQAMSVDAATGVPGADAATILFSRAALTANAPGPWAPKPQFPTLPDLGALPFMALANVDVDALSIGMDKVDAIPNGVMAPSGVGGLLFSVTRGTVGATGSLIAREVGRAGGAAGDVFGYVLPSSFGPASFVDVPMRSHDAREISVDAPGTPGNIDALDLYLGMYFEENPHMSVFVPGIPGITVYFSVTTATIGNVPAPWWNGATPSGAAVLGTTWQPATRTWSNPQPAWLPADLGLQDNEDLDALALDLGRNYVLFSTTRVGAPVTRNALLFTNLSVPGTHHVYRRGDGTPCSQRIGLGGGADDVDGLSTLEPVATNPLPMNHLVGTMFPRLLAGRPDRLSGAVTIRLNQAGTNEEVVARMAGGVVPGPVGNGFAAVTMALGVAAGPYFTMSTFFRPDALSPYFAFDGHPQEFVITIPTSPSFAGAPLYFTWGAFDFGANEFDLTPPVGIVL